MTQKIEASNANLLQVYEENLEAGDSIAAAAAFKEIYSRDLSHADGIRFQDINDRFDVYVSNDFSQQETAEGKYISSTLKFSVENSGAEILPEYLNTIIWDKYGAVVGSQEPNEYVRDGSFKAIDDRYKDAEQSVFGRLKEIEVQEAAKSALDNLFFAGDANELSETIEF